MTPEMMQRFQQMRGNTPQGGARQGPGWSGWYREILLHSEE